MKTLLKSKDYTQIIITALRNHRQNSINEMNKATDREDITEHDRQVIITYSQRQIFECNAVLDEIGTD